MNKAEIIGYLKALGLSEDEASVYVELIRRGEGTPLSVSRETGINRTKVYRTLESLAQKQLVTQELAEHSTFYSPAPVARIGELLKAKQVRVAELAHEYTQIENSLEELLAKASADTKVKFYRGVEGIRQMVWNVLKAKSEIVGYTHRDLTDFVGDKFMREFADEFGRRNLKMRDIYSDEYVENRHVDYDWGGRISSRYLPRKVLAIPHQSDIYDEVVSHYSWSEGEVFGVEIVNERVASMQRQLFELAWAKAKKTKI